MSNFLAPGWLWALLVPLALLVAYVVVQIVGRTRYTVRFANVELIDKVAPKRPGWRRHIITGLVLAALVAIVVATAQPQAIRAVENERTTIMLAIDVSYSMEATDVDPTRLASAQEAATKFVQSLPPGAEVGIVAFSGSARVLVDPTDDGSKLADAIRRLSLGPGTAIGDAVSLSVDVIGDRGTPTKPGEAPTSTTQPDAGEVPVDPGGNGGTGTDTSSDEIPNAAIVVLSDGTTTAGLPTAMAIPIAQQANIPVWTISFGTPDGVIVDPQGMTQPVPVDPEPLRNLAESTGGKAFEADSAEQLDKIYDELKAAAKVRVEKVAISWMWNVGALVALALAAGLSTWWFRRFA